MTTTDDRISLRGGLVVSRHALELLWELERLELRVTVKQNKLTVAPSVQVPAELATTIKKHQTELAALVLYCQDIDRLGVG